VLKSFGGANSEIELLFDRLQINNLLFYKDTLQSMFEAPRVP